MKTKITENAFGCVGNTIRLRSGNYFDLANPDPHDFTFGDLAGALSKICRFGGQTPRFYSVAEHLVHCYTLAARYGYTRGERLAVLMHDAPEAFVGDVVKPLKLMLGDYAAIDAMVEAAIAGKYGINFGRHKDAIHTVDREMLIAERRAMFGGDGVKWTGEDDVRRVDVPIRCWSPQQAEFEFTLSAAMLGIPIDTPLVFPTAKRGTR